MIEWYVVLKLCTMAGQCHERQIPEPLPTYSACLYGSFPLAAKWVEKLKAPEDEIMIIRCEPGREET